jgi:hypothetical protein
MAYQHVLAKLGQLCQYYLWFSLQDIHLIDKQNFVDQIASFSPVVCLQLLENFLLLYIINLQRA